MDDGHLKSGSVCLFSSRFKKVDDDLVADRSHADPEAGTDEFADYPCPGVRLASARRALDGEHVAVKPKGDPARRVEGRLPDCCSTPSGEFVGGGSRNSRRVATR